MGDVTYALLKLYLIFAGLVDSQIYQVKGWGIRAVYGDCHCGMGGQMWTLNSQGQVNRAVRQTYKTSNRYRPVVAEAALQSLLYFSN